MPVVDNVVAMRCKQTSCPDVDVYNIMRICKYAYYVNTLHDLWLVWVYQNKSHNALLIVVKNIQDLRPYLLVPILLAIDGNTFVCSYDWTSWI